MPAFLLRRALPLTPTTRVAAAGEHDRRARRVGSQSAFNSYAPVVSRACFAYNPHRAGARERPNPVARAPARPPIAAGRRARPPGRVGTRAAVSRRLGERGTYHGVSHARAAAALDPR